MLVRSLLVVWIIVSFAGVAGAVPLSSLGQPVMGIGMSTLAVPNCPLMEGDACFNSTTGAIPFYIPLSYSGVYGVTMIDGKTAGTFSDTGSGMANSLTMYLRFTPVAYPAASASAMFAFNDLDLIGDNDPAGFFETVQFFDRNGNPMSQLISMNGQMPGTGALPFTVTGDRNTQTILFSDITSIVQDPFYVTLKFGSQYTSTGRNTMESLTARVDSVPLPEPASMLLLGSGLAGMAFLRKRLI